MGNSFSTSELKTHIARDLKVDVAFPFFPAGRSQGSAACCVVDTEWVEVITKGSTDNRTITLKGPAYMRHVMATDGNPQKQSPTVNIYVNILSKDPAKRNTLQLFEQKVTLDERSQMNDLDCWPLIHYIQSLLEGEGHDNQLEGIVDCFANFDSIFDNQSLSYNETLTKFVQHIQQMLWPRSKRYRIVQCANKEDVHKLCLEQVSGPDRLATSESQDVPATNSTASMDAANSNLPEVFAVVESEEAYYFLASYRGTTLQDLITYNPGVLSSNLKKGFVIYQLLRAVASLHSRGILHGSLKASNILVDENLWTQLAGIEYAASPVDIDIERLIYDKLTLHMTKEIEEDPLVVQWVRGNISNFSYLMALNHLAGRREGDPNFHPILPWVTDFTGKTVADGWRDFTKTKFRMNKGDEQLDFTFDGPVPHHITDILSDITYYVYLARRTPVPVLCQFVRSKYEPNEYPSSMYRLYQWTPDECIPEFYTNPTIFTSIHPDMPDLQIPSWANSPQDFVRKHAEALESEHVSSNLHHWIDLTFGYKLTGKGAVEAKNVALPLLAGQNSFMKHGIIQLFKDKHPQRGCNWSHSFISKEHLKRRVSDIDSFTPASSTIESSAAVGMSKSVKSQRLISVSPPNPSLCESPSSLSLATRDRASSIHSTSSSIDTSISAVSRSMSVPENCTAMTSALRTDPIRLPTQISDDYFMENLVHYEDMLAFAIKYKFINDSPIQTNPVFPNPSRRYNINPQDPPCLPTNKFSIGTAYDMFCLGEIIRSVFTAGNAKVMDMEGEPSQSSASGYFEVGNGDVAYDIAPTGRINQMSPAVADIIDSLMIEDWQARPSAKAILCASFPTMSIRDPKRSFPFHEDIPDIYEYLAAFYQAEWTRRLYLADKWIDRICDLEDEGFFLILPTFTQLFFHNETRVGSISLFPKLAQRLGPERSRRHLLKPIIAMFETLRPNIPRILFDQQMIKEFIKRLGIATFLQQLLPCYLEALAIQDEQAKAVAADDPTPITDGTETTAVSTIVPTGAVSEVAGDVLVHICTLLGPVLTSKHIMRQVVKAIFRDNVAKPLLLQTAVKIASSFGETFTAIQYGYLISLFDTYQKSMTKRNGKIIGNLITLLEALLPFMSAEAIVTELKSGFVTTLYKLLEPLPPSEGSQSIPEPALQLRLTISMRTIEFLLQITHHIPKSDWETMIAPMLQKYFSGFTNTVTGEEHRQGSMPDSLETQKRYQMIYAYVQFCHIVGRETMHRLIPTSDAIESMMRDHFTTGEPSTVDRPLSAVSDASPKSTSSHHPVPSNSSFTSHKMMSWIMPSKSKSTSTDAKSIQKESPELRPSLAVDVDVDMTRLYELSIKDLPDYTKSIRLNIAPMASKVILEPLENGTAAPSPTSAAREQTPISSPKTVDKESKSKVPTSVLPWKTKWKPSPEDKKNWNRFLSTNSEEMSKTMQFSFNDLKLRGFAGHTGTVRTMTVNEPAKIFASGSRDRTVKLWSLNVHDGIEHWATRPFSESLVTYTGHRRGAINDVHFLSGGGSNGLSNIVASCDGHIHLWEPETGKAIHQFNIGRASIVSVKPIFHSRCLVAGALEGHITFFDTHNHRALHTWKSSLNTTGTVRAITVNQAETLIAVGYSTGVISLLESRTGTLVASWKGGDTEITMVKFYTDELVMTCAPADHLICCWNVHRLALVKTIPISQDVVSLDIFKDEILTINGNNSVSFIPINDDFQSYSSKFKSSIIKSQVSSLAIVPTDQLLLFGCTEGEIFLYA